MGSIARKISDEIKLHGSWERYQAYTEEQYKRWLMHKLTISDVTSNEPEVTCNEAIPTIYSE